MINVNHPEFISSYFKGHSQLTFTSSKFKIENLEKSVVYIRNQQ